MTRAELNQAVRHAKRTRGGTFPLSNGWFVSAEKHYPLPARPGPAWHFCYYLISPTRKRFGGYERMDSFVSHFGNPNSWQWRDDYHAAPDVYQGQYEAAKESSNV